MTPGPEGKLMPTYISQGAIPSSIATLLSLIRNEYERPLTVSLGGVLAPKAERLVIVILFWTLFETLIERFYLAALADLPPGLADELLKRNNSISARLERLYKARWGLTFWADLEDLGFGDAATHLRTIQRARNAFVHGDPEAIDDALVETTIAKLRSSQLGFISVFNRRCIGLNRKVQLWMNDTPSMMPPP